MNRLFVILLYVIIGNSNFSNAQVITKHLVDSLNDISYDLGSSFPDSSFRVAQRNLQRARKIDYLSGQMTALCRMGRVIRKKNLLDSSLHYFNRSENLFSKKGKDSIVLAKTFVYQGLVYRNLGRLSLASEKYRRAYSIAKLRKDEGLMGSCLLNLSNILTAQANYKEALIILNDALENFSSDNYSEIGSVYLNMGNVFQLECRTKDAFSSFKSAHEYYLKLDDSYGIAKSLMSLGNVYLELNQADSARVYYEKSHVIAVKHDYFGVLAKTYQNKGEYFFNQNKIDSAFHFFTRSIESNEKVNSVVDLPIAYERLGDIYISKQNFSKGLRNYLVGYENSMNLSDHAQLKDLTSKISTAYSLLGKPDSAFVYLNYSNRYQDTISQRLNDALVYEINFNKERHKVDTLNLKLNQQALVLKKQKTISWLSIILGFSAILALFVMFRLFKQRKNNAIKQKEIDDLMDQHGEENMNAMLDGQEKEKTRIASELHDGLGVLLSTVKLYFKSMDEEIEKLKGKNIEHFETANNLLDEACDEVRKIAHELSTGTLKDQGLFQAVKVLTDKIQGADGVIIELITHGTDDDLLLVNQSAIYRIIQESITNILKHASADKINIQLNVFDDLFNLIIEDDGVGFDANQMVSNSGMGLRSNKARVSKMNGTFNIDSGKGIGTTINIDIPLDEQS